MSQARTLADFVSGTTTITGNPTFSGTVDGVGGAMVLVGQSTASSGVSVMDVTGLDDTYTNLMFTGHFFNNTDSVNLQFRFLDDAGGAIAGGSDYHYSKFKYRTSVNAGSHDDAHGFIILSATVGSASEEDGINIKGFINGIGSNNLPMQLISESGGEDEAGSYEGNLSVGGLKDKTKTFGGIRFFFSSGNIGTNSYVKVYGLVNS